MTILMDVVTMLLFATWFGIFVGLSVLVLARVANLIVREFLN